MQRLMKVIEFNREERPFVVFSNTAKIRLNDDVPHDPAITLKPSSGAYPTDLNLSVTTKVMTPQRLYRWVGFDADEVTPDGTSIKYRLIINAGASEVWWNGSAWAAAATDGEWSTREDLFNNMATLPLTAKDIRVKANLRTSDPATTPRLQRVKLAGDIQVEWFDDLIYDTIIRSMRSAFRATTTITVEVVSSTSTIDFQTAYKLDNSGYNFTGVKAAFNLTDDPQRFANLASSYAPGAVRPDGTNEEGVVTLTGPVAAGKILEIEMEYEPEIAVYTSQDYYEIKRLPLVAFERIATVRLKNRTDQESNEGLEGEVVKNRILGTAIQLKPPRQSTVRFEFALFTNSNSDMARLISAMDKWIINNRKLRTWGLDEEVYLDPVSEIESSSKTDLSDVTTFVGSFQIRGVPFYIAEAQDVPLVLEVNNNFVPG